MCNVSELLANSWDTPNNFVKKCVLEAPDELRLLQAPPMPVTPPPSMSLGSTREGDHHGSGLCGP